VSINFQSKPNRSLKEQRMPANSDNIATVKAMYEALARSEVEPIVDAVTDDVDWSTDAALPAAPWYGPRRGKDGVRSFFAAIVQAGPITEFTPLVFTSNDEGDVMVFIRYAFTVTETGKSAEMNMHHLFRFRDGKAYYVRSAEDTAQVAAAFAP
jgi:ketosteroid isomerase-like protein